MSAVFAVAAWGKLADRDGTRQAVVEFGVPVRWAKAVAWALPAVEVVVAVAVLPSGSAVLACAAALGLLAVFTAAVATQLRQGKHPSCSCFGTATSKPITGWTVVRNGLIAVLVLAALTGSWTTGDVPQQLPAEYGIGVPVVVLLLAITAVQAATIRELRDRLARSAAALAVEGLPVGTTAPPFDLPGVDGGRGSLDGLLETGRAVLLIFVHPNCPSCHALAPQLPAWRDQHRETVTMVPISSGDLAVNATFAQELQLGRLLVQQRTETATLYRATRIPSAVLIDADGRIAAPLARTVAGIRELLTSPGFPATPAHSRPST
ncbi:redoxin domain-containing protein [Crossiella sp. SN42]|nr:redoxin domain-containing protein [Crossiella sp. SN42]